MSMDILGRIKETASAKASEAKKGIAKEGRYQAYKHPDTAYITKGQNKSEDYEETAEFAERKQREAQKSAERRAAIKAKAGALASNIKAKLSEQRAKRPQRPQRPRRPAPSDDFLGFGGGRKMGGFELGIGGKSKGFDPIGFGGSMGRSRDPLGFGGKREKFNLF